MKSIIYNISLLLLLISSGCRDYVEIDEVGNRILYYTDDYQYLMNNTTNFESTFIYPELASDDISIENDDYIINTESHINAYTWADQISLDANDSDWDRMFRQIEICNEIIEGVLNSEGGTEAEKRNVWAQAKVHRAYAYFCLVNIYAKQYDEQTASTDLGVPLLLSADFFADLTRASVETIYHQVESDLKEALVYLPDFQLNTSMPSKAAAYGTLARVYLQKEVYPQALAYADSALSIQNTLLNLADYAGNITSLPRKYDDEEIIFSKILAGYTLDYQLSQDLLDLFSEQDLRYQMFTDEGAALTWNPTAGRYFSRPRIFSQGVYSGPCVSEMMLIKAECLVRDGNAINALEELNRLRQHRFMPEDYEDLTAADSEEALYLVINERRMELMGRGYRWFDQKRLNKDSRFAATVTHQYQGETYTLEPNSVNYVFPIADVYIVQNPEIVQNPRD